AVVAQHHAVVGARRGQGHEPAAHVGLHLFGRAIVGVAPAAAAAGLDAHDVAALEDRAVAERLDDALVGTAGIDHAAAAAAVLAAGDAPGRIGLDADREHRVVGQHLNLADHAAAAAIAARPARIRIDRVAQQPHRVGEVE